MPVITVSSSVKSSFSHLSILESVCAETGGCRKNVPNIQLISRENSNNRQNAGPQAFLQWYGLFMCGKVLREGGAGSPLHMFGGAVVSNKSKKQTKAWHWILRALDCSCSTCQCHTSSGFYCAHAGQGSVTIMGHQHTPTALHCSFLPVWIMNAYFHLSPCCVCWLKGCDILKLGKNSDVLS